MKKLLILFIIILSPVLNTYAKNHFKEGNEFYLNGKYQEALKEYSEFIQKNNDYYEGYYNAGNAYFRQGDYQKALEMYKKAYELNNKDEDIQHNIRITEEKLKQQSQCNNQQQNKNNKEDKNQQSQNTQQQSQGNKQSQQNQQQTQNNQAQQNENQSGNQQKYSGMTDDEVQALLNMKKRQEQQLKQYFGKQQKKNYHDEDFPDFFNMTPDEIMRYMEQRMMNPFAEPKKNRGQSGDKKDW